MRNEKISVCMATYNGEKYIKEQISSILNQLISNDELIIVDDASKDSTLKIIKDFNDSRIIIIQNKINMGVVGSFNKAINIANNEYIFMADQDDIWCNNRVEIMIDALKNENADLVTGNQIFIDIDRKEIDYNIPRLKQNESKKTMINIINIFKGSCSYYGCTMAFNKKLRDIILQIPNYVESHDLWIAFAGIITKKSSHIEDNVLYRRIHGNNCSCVKRSLIKKVWSRIIHVLSIFHLLFRYLKRRFLNIGTNSDIHT